MNNKLIAIEMYVELWVNVVKLNVQCDRLLLPFFLIASIARLNYWWLFCQSIPCIWYHCWMPFDVLISLYVLVDYLLYHFPNCAINSIEVTRNRRPIFLSDTMREIFIEITGNRFCCVATNPIMLNSELSSTS